MKGKSILLIIIMLFANLTIISAKIPYLINYQGKLMENGVPVNGSHNIVFRIYDAPTDGTLIWEGDVQTVQITNGLFSAYIGETTAVGSPIAFSNIDWGSGDKYLEIQIDTDTMQPRERLTSVAYALFAKDIEDNSVTSNEIVDNTVISADIKDGTIRKVDTADEIKNYLVPPGTIVMWSGSIANIPAGWVLCDGNNGTPDLRGRFIVCVGPDPGGVTTYNVGDTGGESKHTLTINEIPPHSHTYLKYGAWGPEAPHSGSDWQGYETQNTSTVGGGQPHENRPPYYALAYIMKL